jgi:hypothetical protein
MTNKCKIVPATEKNYGNVAKHLYNLDATFPRFRSGSSSFIKGEGEKPFLLAKNNKIKVALLINVFFSKKSLAVFFAG